MAEVRELVEAEMEHVERTVAELPRSDSVERLSPLELAGVAALVHNFYNGVENILKQVLISRGNELPRGPAWHRDLLDIVGSKGILSETTAKELGPYLAFRHFFSHSYAFDLDGGRIAPLVRDVQKVLSSFRDDINRALAEA